MATAPKLSWTNILTQVSASLDGLTDKQSAEIVALKPAVVAAEAPPQQSLTVRNASDLVDAGQPSEDETPIGAATAEGDAEGLADWMSTLDIINGMAGLADGQRRRLREQTASHQAVVTKLQRDLKIAQERLEVVEAKAHELETRADLRLQRAQAEADAQVQEIRDEAETRVRTIHAEARAWVLKAEERVRIADLKSATAEQWLQRIDSAARNLLLNGHMNVDHEE